MPSGLPGVCTILRAEISGTKFPQEEFLLVSSIYTWLFRALNLGFESKLVLLAGVRK